MKCDICGSVRVNSEYVCKSCGTGRMTKRQIARCGQCQAPIWFPIPFNSILDTPPIYGCEGGTPCDNPDLRITFINPPPTKKPTVKTIDEIKHLQSMTTLRKK